jgi:hypothetical protein
MINPISISEFSPNISIYVSVLVEPYYIIYIFCFSMKFSRMYIILFFIYVYLDLSDLENFTF